MDEKITGWGNYPVIEASIQTPDMPDNSIFSSINKPVVPRGLGRSYGDSAISRNLIITNKLNKIESFDPVSGIVICESGVTFEDIINTFLHRGWFLSCTPGTKYISVGGAIASDVHGKNHHITGCFSQCVKFFNLMMPDGKIYRCSRTENPDFFYATCGGMGLTGLIIKVAFRLKPVNSCYINQITYKAKNLEHLFELFQNNAHIPYSVAWIDCLTTGTFMGRSLFMAGDHANDNILSYYSKKQVNMPVNLPSFFINSWSVRAFNFLYYHRIRQDSIENKVDFNTFFYPLDAIDNWNRMYGKNGFTQYQFVLPKETSLSGLRKILSKISDSGLGSFLAVLKLFGKSNKNWLSFPQEGYTLALDMKIEPKLFPLLDQLDEIVAEYGGKIYLAKDVRMSKKIFQKGYLMLDKFKEFRQKHKLTEILQSLQSMRLEY